MPLSRYCCSEIAADATLRGIVAEISDAIIWRWLDQDAICRWRSQLDPAILHRASFDAMPNHLIDSIRALLVPVR